MKRVTVRFYAAGNFGDDLLLKILADRYSDEFVYTRYRRGGSLARVRNLRGRGGIFSTRVKIVFARLFGKPTSGFQKPARNTDVFVYIGGSIFIDNGDTAFWDREETFYASLTIPYHIIGANFGPSRSANFVHRAERIFAKAADVCFRDLESYRQFEHLDTVRSATDIAFSLNTAPYQEKELDVAKNSNSILISVIDGSNRFAPDVVERYESDMAMIAEKAARSGDEVVFASFCEYEGDLAAAERIVARLSPAVRSVVRISNYDGDIDSMLSLIGRSDVVVGSRFHAIVLALRFAKRVVPYAYSDKTLSLLNDVGFQGPVFDIRDIARAEVADVTLDHFPVADVSALVALAERQFELLDRVLTRAIAAH